MYIETQRTSPVLIPSSGGLGYRLMVYDVKAVEMECFSLIRT
jgi:hypothetical protein